MNAFNGNDFRFQCIELAQIRIQCAHCTHKTSFLVDRLNKRIKCPTHHIAIDLYYTKCKYWIVVRKSELVSWQKGSGSKKESNWLGRKGESENARIFHWHTRFSEWNDNLERIKNSVSDNNDVEKCMSAEKDGTRKKFVMVIRSVWCVYFRFICYLEPRFGQ